MHKPFPFQVPLAQLDDISQLVSFLHKGLSGHDFSSLRFSLDGQDGLLLNPAPYFPCTDAFLPYDPDRHYLRWTPEIFPPRVSGLLSEIRSSFRGTLFQGLRMSITYERILCVERT